MNAARRLARLVRASLSIVAPLVAALALLAPARLALADGAGFQLDRYEPTPAGEPFFSVEHPWYRPTRWFAGGLTFDYGYNSLVLRSSPNAADGTAVIAHELVGHLDLAGSFWNRLLISASVPMTLMERGTPANGAAAIIGTAVGDPRVGLTLRLYGRPDRDAFSLHLGAHLWIPIGATGDHAGDANVRFLPKAIASGVSRWLRWSASAGFLVRSEANLGAAQADGGNGVGPSLQLGGAIGLVNRARTLTVGPEAVASMMVTGTHAWEQASTSVEVLLGAHYLVFDNILIGAAIGTGILRDPGNPDVRAIVRVAWAPAPPLDSDEDGILDREDACPHEKGVRTEDPRTNGCPQRDRDHDQVLDDDDLCPDVHKGEHPDPARLGCPALDSDHDGVFDYEDICPTTPAGPYPDPARKGCPLPDRDGDGVLDRDDECPDVPAGATPDPQHPGCPLVVPCLTDRDKDFVPDAVDACPDEPGVPDADPKKNGCPVSKLVVVKGGMIVILEPVYFATDKDVILPRSYPLLAAVADVLARSPDIKRVAIEGHTDIRGTMAHNMDLSDRRANSVRRWLVENGVAPARLEAHGYGPTRPIASNKSDKGRSTNRRVEFRIVDPAPSAGEGSEVKMQGNRSTVMPDAPIYPDAGHHKATKKGAPHKKR